MHFHRLSLKTPSLLALAVLLGAVAACQSGPGHAPPGPELRVGTSGDYPPFSDWKEERPHGFIEDLPQEAKVLAASREAVRSAAGALDRAAPSDAALDAFFQAQIDAAKGVQRRSSIDAGAPSPSLDKELRPAIARISDRMAGLVARLPDGLDEATVMDLAQDWLGSSGLDAAERERIARTLAALRPGPASKGP